MAITALLVLVGVGSNPAVLPWGKGSKMHYAMYAIVRNRGLDAHIAKWVVVKNRVLASKWETQ